MAFDGSGSSDPELQYEWDFGDGQTGTGIEPIHTYADDGEYEVCLTVTNVLDDSDTDCTIAIIANIAPTVSTGEDQAVHLGDEAAIAAAFNNPRINDAPWAWEIDWGDGTSTAGSSDDQDEPVIASHTYGEVGGYEVTVCITDKDGDTGCDTLTITVVLVATWLPPVTDEQFVLQDGTTLPLKFQLTDALGDLISEAQDVYLALHGPAEDQDFGPEVHIWELGDGRGALRFDEDEAAYVANFHTRDFPGLTDGATYTAVIRSSQTEAVFGMVDFELSAEQGTGRGRPPG